MRKYKSGDFIIDLTAGIIEIILDIFFDLIT